MVTSYYIWKQVEKFFLHFFLILFGFIMILPLYWMIITSLKYNVDILSWPPELIPKRITLDNYIKVIEFELFFRYFANSIFVTLIGTISILFTSSIAGYVFAKFRFKYKKFLFSLIIATLMIPVQVYMVPLFVMMNSVGLVDTYTGIIAPVLIGSFGVFFMRQNINSIPDDIIDSGRIDGLSEFQIFRKLIVPLSTAPISALTIFTVMEIWGFFIWPLIITNSQRKYVLEIGITMFQSTYYINFGLTMAASTMALAPVIIAFFFFRRKIIDGISLTGLKA